MAFAVLCNLPQDSTAEKELNDSVIALLYNTVPHPPATFVGTDRPSPLSRTPIPSASSGNGTVHIENGHTRGSANGNVAQAPKPSPPRSAYAFRSADGSDNNVLLPNMGKAGTPYARSVQNKHPLAPHTLPDPGLIFDALLKAREVRKQTII